MCEKLFLSPSTASLLVQIYIYRTLLKVLSCDFVETIIALAGSTLQANEWSSGFLPLVFKQAEAFTVYVKVVLKR